MKRTIATVTLLAPGLLLGLPGCTGKDSPKQPVVAAASAPVGPATAASAVKCAASAPRACLPLLAASSVPVNTCVEERGHKTVCRVMVAASGPDTYVYPYNLNIATREKVTIVWSAFDNSIAFPGDDSICLEDDSTGEFEDGAATDDPTGDQASSASSPHFRMKHKWKARKDHKYQIKITLKTGGPPRSCDPTINSSGG